MRKNIIRKEIYVCGSKYDDVFGYEIPITKSRYYIDLKDLKNLVLELDFEGAISTRELLKEIGYEAPDLNSRSSDEDSLNKDLDASAQEPTPKESQKSDSFSKS